MPKGVLFSFLEVFPYLKQDFLNTVKAIFFCPLDAGINSLNPPKWLTFKFEKGGYVKTTGYTRRIWERYTRSSS